MLTDEEKISDVDKQLADVQLSTIDHFTCPWCRLRTFNGGAFCCFTMARAVAAILERKAIQELTEHAYKIADQVLRN